MDLLLFTAAAAAGGMGASAVLSVLSELEASHAAAAAAGSSVLPVLLIWCCRSIMEFEFMGPRVLAMLHAVPGLQPTVELYLTGTTGHS